MPPGTDYFYSAGAIHRVHAHLPGPRAGTLPGTRTPCIHAPWRNVTVNAIRAEAPVCVSQAGPANDCRVLQPGNSTTNQGETNGRRQKEARRPRDCGDRGSSIHDRLCRNRRLLRWEQCQSPLRRGQFLQRHERVQDGKQLLQWPERLQGARLCDAYAGGMQNGGRKGVNFARLGTAGHPLVWMPRFLRDIHHP